MTIIAFCDHCGCECYWDDYTTKDGRRTFRALREVDGEEWHYFKCKNRPVKKQFNPLFKRGQHGKHK